MPGKHVHFADVSTHDVSSPIATARDAAPYITVLSSNSSSVSSSSPEPRSPPPLGFGSPYTIQPLPGLSQPNPIFTRDFCRRYFFDMSQHPSASPSMSKISRNVFQESASLPPTKSMIFICERLPWSITIQPSNGEMITVYDLFEGLYNSLRKAVLPDEFKALSKSEQTEVINAYHTRCKRFFDIPHIYEQEMEKGVKRVDLLGKHTILAGIDFKTTMKGPRWELFTKENLS